MKATVLLVVLIATAATAPAETPDPKFAAAVPAIVPGLVELADWCKTKGLRRERAGVFEAILLFDPDHAEARRGLGYRRRGGSWHRSEGWRQPRTTREEHVMEFRQRRRRIAEPFVRETLAALVEQGPEGAGPARDRVVAGLTVLLPESPELRAFRGEERVGREWRLAETVRAAKRRSELRDLASSLHASAPAPRVVPPDDVAREIPLPWVASLAGEYGSVTGIVRREEIEVAVRVMGVTVKLWRDVFGGRDDPGAGFAMHLLNGPARHDEYLDAHPRLSERDREFARALDGVWATEGRTAAVWSLEEDRRKESVGRYTLVLLMGGRFNMSTERGALHEGIGLFFGELASGTKVTWFVRQTEYGAAGKEFEVRLRKKDTDWRVVARDLSREGRPPDLGALLAKDVNGLERPDLVHAYAFAAYLVEGQPDGWIRFIDAVGRGTHYRRAAREWLGRSIPELERRLIRWLEETTAS